MSSTSSTRFLNVDLELVSTVDLTPLLCEFAEGTITLRDTTENFAQCVWLGLAADHTNPDAAIRAFASLISALPPQAKQLWDHCQDRCLNVGIQAGAAPRASHFRLEADTLAMIVALGARLELTVYAHDSGSADGPPS